MAGLAAQDARMTITTDPAPSTTDVRDLLARAAAVTADTIAIVTPEQLTNPTPCDELDVRAILAHLVGVVDRAAAMGRGEDPMSAPGTIDAEGDLWSEAFAAVVADNEKAWLDDAALERVVVLPWLTAPGGIALLGYVNELVVHTWDLAQGIGATPVWDDDVVAAAYEAISSGLPAEGRLEMFEKVRENMDTSRLPEGFGGAPFAEAVAVAADAPLIDRLVAYTGRRPATAT
jgi:uncharacterized protein (TIGR03086 family)